MLILYIVSVQISIRLSHHRVHHHVMTGTSNNIRVHIRIEIEIDVGVLKHFIDIFILFERQRLLCAMLHGFHLNIDHIQFLLIVTILCRYSCIRSSSSSHTSTTINSNRCLIFRWRWRWQLNIPTIIIIVIVIFFVAITRSILVSRERHKLFARQNITNHIVQMLLIFIIGTGYTRFRQLVRFHFTTASLLAFTVDCRILFRFRFRFRLSSADRSGHTSIDIHLTDIICARCIAISLDHTQHFLRVVQITFTASQNTIQFAITRFCHLLCIVVLWRLLHFVLFFIVRFLVFQLIHLRLVDLNTERV
mmetsp:Transcript_34592/g.56361  ORF Transcript_34592/g.56361 Transcript_34592/m.56361 type:complete len:306 (-) Transcript_34592:257-1174(-)